MYVSINWLKEYVDIGNISVDELAEKITKSGVEVDHIIHVGKEIEGVVVGYVKSCDQHPNADKLNVCTVDVGTETLTIVCGAPNIAEGQKVAVATPGSTLPGDFHIKEVELRGVKSNGMICSLQELAMDEAYIPPTMVEGIVVLDEEAVIGNPVTPYINLDDTILEFDLTPNRSDCLSMLGVAYEVAAILEKPIRFPTTDISTIAEKASDAVQIDVEDKEACPYYAAFVIKDVTVKPSPLWMQNKLLAAGVRPINNVVDITNYVLMEYGQPLHAFDFDRLNSSTVGVRHAQDGETLVTLDEETRTLSSDNLVITDGTNPIALAGVMGGASTEVHEGTTTILLEAAYFEPSKVRTSVQQTGLRSESSTRFEKGIDPNRVYEAGQRACALFAQLAGGSVLANAPIVDQADRTEKHVLVDVAKVNIRLGTEITVDEIKTILKNLRFNYTIENDVFDVQIPTRRGDITIFEDMLEEIARMYGYDHLPYTLPASPSKPGGLSIAQQLKRNVNRFMQGAGYMETITYSLTNEERTNMFISPDIKEYEIHPVRLAMPMSEDHAYLRASIIPELLGTIAYNRARKQANLAYYEIGSIFLSEEKEITKQPEENVRLSGVITGNMIDHKWQQEKKTVDFFAVKGLMEQLFDYIRIPVTFSKATITDMHPGRCATLSVDEEVIGYIGQVHPRVARDFDSKDTYMFDVNFDRILALYERKEQFNAIPKYPAITRDVAFIVNEEIVAGDILQVIKKVGSPLVTEVEVFDVYQGEHLEENQKSIAYHLHYQDPSRTLKDKDVDKLHKTIIEKVNETFDSFVRS